MIQLIIQEFRFQQLCRFKVTDEPVTSNDRLQLLTNSSKYALTFVAVKEGLKVIDTQELIKLNKEHATDKSVSTISNVPLRTIIPFTDKISHLVISCDDLTLAVACSSNGNVILYMYDVRGFANNQPNPFKTVRLNTSPGSSLCDVSWNPEITNIIITCTTDGGVELLEVNDNVQVSTLSVSTNATCFCWSPKGKQFVVGSKDGRLTQYDRTLVAKKNWPCPPILEGGPYQVVDIVWLSTYMFLVAYLPQTPDASDQPQVVMITSSKEGNTTYANFEDICFGSGEVRKAKYYMSLIMKW
ncbi:hypothetical protein LOTGIDRAFT_114119 [Lottia gigantea]|uniref:Nucleoporin Nup159/Nup146 N-terminal domain-containing protein n=1 Tax=Lottia gigantea TaxID=225164 RepID=V4A481_LOTGI|nr:hypothetical protein LOTGIDRAFT_114119 [Lottia gigantea]ESO98723.1 hypothetical protein LOTGIDRAFT_114119 [Lottia gigantea]